MSTSNVSVKQSSIQYGVVLGGILALLTVLMYALNPDLFVNTWAGIGIILITIAVGIVSSAKAKSLLNGFISFKGAFTAYFIPIAIGLLIGTLISIIVFNVLDPELGTYITEKTIDITREFGEKWATTDEAKAALEANLAEMAEKNNFSLSNQLLGYLWSVAGYSVIGLLIGLIFKRKDPNAID